MEHDRNAVTRRPPADWTETSAMPPCGAAVRPRRRSPTEPPAIPPCGIARRPRRRSPIAALVLAVAAGINGGCGMPRMPEIPGVYRIDIQQGNAVDREMLDRLEIGMDRSKVRFILGTPLLADPFHQDRWDYVYSLRSGSEPEVRQRVSLYFTGDRLARIEDHLDPDAFPGMASERIQTLVTVPPRRAREGFLDALVPDFLKRNDNPADAPPAEGGAPLANEATEDADPAPSGAGTGTTSSE